MPGAGHRFYFVEKVPLAFALFSVLLFLNTFLMLLLDFVGKHFLPKNAPPTIRWYEDNSITIQFVLLALLGATLIIFRKRVRWIGQR